MRELFAQWHGYVNFAIQGYWDFENIISFKDWQSLHNEATF